MFRNSGKDYNDFGRFKQCKKKEGFVYYLVTCKDDDKCDEKFLTTMSIGLCVPASCSADDIQSILPDYLYLINSIAIPYEFSHIVKKNESNPVLMLDDLKIMDSEKLNSDVTKIRFGNVMMIMFIISMGAAVIGSTVYGWSEEKKIQKEKLLEKAKVAEENLRQSDSDDLRRSDSQTSVESVYSTVQDKDEPVTLK